MKKVIFHIDSNGEQREVTLEDEVSFGRTDLAQIVLPDSGLSRLNTTIFRDGDEVFIVDENSTNGTFVNGEQVSGNPHLLADRDEVTIGNNTRIYVEIFAENRVTAETKTQDKPQKPATEKKTKKSDKSKNPVEEKKFPMIPVLAGLSVFLIIFVALIVILILPRSDNPNGNGKPTPPIASAALIPVRVIDPLGGEDPYSIDDLIAVLEQDVADDVQDVSSFDEIKGDKGGETKDNETGLNLDVPLSEWQKQKDIAMAPRPEPTGTDPPGQIIPPEIAGGGGVPKQKAKLAEMNSNGYQQPMDFSDLAQRRLNGELIELPMATQTFFLDVGGNASEAPFVGFDFDRFKTSLDDCYFDITPNLPKYQPLLNLANKFKYDLNNPRDRKQMRIRLLRMFNKKALPILQKLAEAYYNKFKKPLRVTSLTRSMDYQISLNKNNVNSFKVSGKGSLPPHTSGCAFDLSRKQMTAEEQNFVMAKLAEMERSGILDGLREGGANACFHTFIYFDGVKPKGF